MLKCCQTIELANIANIQILLSYKLAEFSGEFTFGGWGVGTKIPQTIVPGI